MKRAALILLMLVLAVRLATATTDAWVRSYTYDDRLVTRWTIEQDRQTLLREFFIYSVNGSVAFSFSRYGPFPPGFGVPSTGRWSTHRRPIMPQETPRASLSRAFIDRGGVQIGSVKGTSVDAIWIMLPYWLIEIVVLIIPGSLICLLLRRPLRRSRRLRRGLCHDCGYDLRGSITRRCPECGSRRVFASRPEDTAATPRPHT